MLASLCEYIKNTVGFAGGQGGKGREKDREGKVTVPILCLLTRAESPNSWKFSLKSIENKFSL